MKRIDTKKIVMIGVFSALAFVMTCLGNLIPIKVAGFLDYDPKDILIVIAGFILGPASALIISVITALIELITISTTGPIGLVMNIISSAFFACTASVIYQKKRTFAGAIIALLCGVVAMCLSMMLWNYLITPLYMTSPNGELVSREFVASLLPTVFLPFNLIKGTLNASFAMLLYKPVVNAMRSAHLLERVEGKKSDTKILLIVGCVVLIAICILGLLILGGVI